MVKFLLVCSIFVLARQDESQNLAKSIVYESIGEEVIDADVFSKQFIKDFELYRNTHIEHEEIKDMRSTILGTSPGNIILKGFSPQVDSRNCLRCYSILNVIIWHHKNYGFNNPHASKVFLKTLCIYLDIATSKICDGSVEAYFDSVKYILDNKNITAEYACGIILQGFHCQTEEVPYNEIAIEKPVLIGSKRYVSNSTGILKILQLTDLHYDIKYVEGSDTACPEWICCRGSELAFSNKSRAGKWGDLRSCDSPSHQILNLMQQAAKTHINIDAIYLTGNYVDHFVWDKTIEDFTYAVQYTTELIQEYFPGIPVFPVLGNHDIFPDNMYAPKNITDEKVSSRWLYESFSLLWKNWLPEDALTTFKTGGYYTNLLRPNLRVVVLNSNVCYTSNFWLIYDNFFFRNQLEWLNNVLQKASLNNEKVHILSHIPSNDIHCYYIWTREFKKIVERYTHIISAQFNGHSHLDEFVLFYAEDDPFVALNVAWNGGSGTNFPNVNSNYKIYNVSDESYDVVDFETWIYNITAANASPEGEPHWFKEYSFRNLFNLTDLSPHSLNMLVRNMATDKQLLREYWKVTVKQSDAALADGCNTKFLADVWSSITRSTFDNSKRP